MRRKTVKENIRKLTRLGKVSTVVSIPIRILKKLKWREKQKVVVKRRGKKIIIEDWPARSGLKKK